ncbi:MAG: MTH1187 family thiamine-binding protein [bacterium]|jgi:uncharacterized protein (TIGR00106 family)
MSCLTLISITPIGESESVSEYVAKAVEIIDNESKINNFEYQLTSMGTIIETNNIKESLNLIEKAINEVIQYIQLKQNKNPRLSILIKMDIRQGKNRINLKIESVKSKLKK